MVKVSTEHEFLPEELRTILGAKINKPKQKTITLSKRGRVNIERFKAVENSLWVKDEKSGNYTLCYPQAEAAAEGPPPATPLRGDSLLSESMSLLTKTFCESVVKQDKHNERVDIVLVSRE